MDLLEDAGRAFFGALYDLRVPVAIGAAVAAVAIVVLAWRRGWVAAARRHPGRAGTLGALALAVGLPLTWYLASPIFLRTALVEPEPVIAAATATPPFEPASSPVPSDTGAVVSPTPTPPPTPAPFQPTTVARGEFHGSDEVHFGRGTATIIEVEPGRYRLRLEDFSVLNGPDLYVYLSPSKKGYADGALELGKLKATDGAFGYDLPDGIDPRAYASAIIWCKQFSHLFATAPFTQT